MKQKAFTLIELLVVIVIVGILATVSTATYKGYIDQANETKRFVEQVQCQRAYAAAFVSGGELR